MGQKTPIQALNYNAIASQLDANAALSKFDFVNIQSGATKITLADSAFANGGNSTTSLKAGNVSFFSNPASGTAGTVSYKGNGTQFFQTGNSNVTTQVSTQSAGGSGAISVKQTATNSNQTLANKVLTLPAQDYVIIGGLVAAAVLLYVILK